MSKYLEYNGVSPHGKEVVHFPNRQDRHPKTNSGRNLRNAPRPWGMQPNTSLAALSPRFPWAFPCSCLCAYYTMFGNFWVSSCDGNPWRFQIPLCFQPLQPESRLNTPSPCQPASPEEDALITLPSRQRPVARSPRCGDPSGHSADRARPGIGGKPKPLTAPTKATLRH